MLWWYMDWVLAIVACIGGLYLYGSRHLDFFKRKNFPSMPSPLPFLGHMGAVIFSRKSMADLTREAYNKGAGYDFYGMFEFMNPAIMIRDPEAIKTITIKDFDYFTDRVPILTEDVDFLFGKSLFGLEGQKWRDMRATLSPAFTTNKMKAMFVLVSQSGEQLANHLEKRCKGEGTKLLELEMKDLFGRYSNDVIATSAFGIRVDSLEEPDNDFITSGRESINLTPMLAIKFMFYKISPALLKFLGIPLRPERMNQFFRSLVVDTMEVREREGIIRPDMIHLLMEAKKGTLKHEGTDDVDETTTVHKANLKFGGELSDDDMTAQAFLFFLAGFETISINLSFLTHLIATHPDVQRRLHEEIDAILQEDGGKLTYEGVQRAKYLDMCVSEALRLWPPAVSSNRQCAKAYVLPATENTPSINMEKGDAVVIPIIGLHRDPQYFPDPERFDPERFSDENKHNIQPFTYMPFGTGPRNCIGMRFALMEIKAAMIHLLSRFNLEVSSKTPKELIFAGGMNVNIKGGFWLGVSPRE